MILVRREGFLAALCEGILWYVALNEHVPE